MDRERLQATVRTLAGVRHPRAAPDALEAAAELLTRGFRQAGLQTERRPFEFRGRSYDNVVGRLVGSRPEEPAVLVGAHYDTVPGSPGADDNASGVAVLLETARRAARERVARTIEFVGFNLEEPQDLLGSYRIGSGRFAESARRAGRRYAGALILEMVGYTDPRPGAQTVPPFVFKRVPDTGTFLAAVGDGRSRKLLRAFAASAARHVPELTV
ncbi:MAG: M20/M25/M40 family metallo-hydrolase, partial [Gemmatimonadetes bacterium]|nr:M20/M25/M40 family metallo-hydrolase [Gemmatimonadota bacterium]NIQ56485.1 M20/M25/M40 family metallo-hydrolase [Gemmatimonadota bacterium]NIU76673.1 M20/M25/M40 family metallo-hydrolase [Gammaproteobacteria bacterium]NIX22437.1 M20/M25/M40 family metallo-hydrolase [Actinomycetota bacterium]NIX46108.1 M20/M25/M40 family metallo-hydrolase [Gemmatimonadota bacterium]